MKVLVTGATGLVGCHATAALLRAGHAVRVLARRPDRVAQALAPVGALGVEVVAGDVTDVGSVRRALDGCDSVVHAAALYSLDAARTRELWRTNARGAELVLRQAVERELDPVVHVSSLSALLPTAQPVLTPDAPVARPRGAYGRSKARAERVARELQAAGAPVVTLYPGAVWAPDDPTVGDGVEAVLEFVRGGFVPVGAGGMPIVDARDLARAIAALLVPGRGPRRYLAGGNWIPHEELARLLESLTGRTLLRLRLPEAFVRLLGHLGDVASRLGAPTPLRSETTDTMLGMVPSDDSALEREFGIALRPARETLADTLRWALAAGRLRASEAGLLAPPAAPLPLPWRSLAEEEEAMPAREVHFGYFLPQIALSWAEIEARVRLAERLGFHSVWLMDHLWAPGAEDRDCFESWTLATALAARTERIRLGHLVLCNAFRHPALLAKMAATLDHVSDGRLELGLGWGSVPAELAAFGVGEEPPAVRAARLRETLEILRLLWSGERVSYEGRFFRLKDAIARPLPRQPRLPIHVGGAGPKLTLPIVRDHADWWNCVSTGVAKLDELRPLAGRARVSVQHPVALAADAAERERVRERAERRFAGWGGVVAGTADEVSAVLAREARAGVELFIAAFADGGRPESLERFARDVMPAVRAGA